MNRELSELPPQQFAESKCIIKTWNSNQGITKVGAIGLEPLKLSDAQPLKDINPKNGDRSALCVLGENRK